MAIYNKVNMYLDTKKENNESLNKFNESQEVLISSKGGGGSLEGGNIVVFYYHNGSEITADKRDGLIRGTTVQAIFLNFDCLLHTFPSD